MKLKVGFAGIGAMGLSHLKAIHQNLSSSAEAVAFSSNNEANIRQALAIAPNAQVLYDDRELIRSDHLDAVFIATPNFTHLPLALEALKTGKHVFLEKPIGITSAECRELAEASDKTDRIVMVGHELRYSPYFRRIKELCDTGELGAVRMVWCREFRGPFQKKSHDWIQDNRQSGGALVDKNCHHFDLMNWWAGSRPRSVAAFAGNTGEPGAAGERQVHDHATVSFEYENAVRGTLQLCMFAPKLEEENEELEMGVIGDKGLLQTRLSQLQILVWKREADSTEPEIHNVDARRGEGWGGHLGFGEMHEAFVHCVLESQKPITTVRECLGGSLLPIAAEESARRREVVSVAYESGH